MRTKDNVVSELKFILAQYTADLERELFLNTDEMVLLSISNFKDYLNILLNDTSTNLTISEYTDDEYFRIIENSIAQVKNVNHFDKCKADDKKLILKIIDSTDNKIQEALKKAKS